ncbi:unannotated protein [freshwater metagenome]|uniref:Unannotated protein n=1 Tax=freshwater metagenome TaxID=449393 RepID=A0A6J7DDF6_9ZZZZ|nr:hypothetical protein [Actinomycetota bacterium]
MTAGELAVVLATVLCSIGFAALIVVLMRVLDTLKSLRVEVESLRAETRPLLAELQLSTNEARITMAEARHDLDRFDRVLGSAEAISDAVSGSGRVARAALSVPVIKVAGFATGTGRAWRRLRRIDQHAISPTPGSRRARRRAGIEKGTQR